ncbi:MAG TPA: DNA polymerase III subunit gamma/tau [Solirubrobacteraceae bacterium]|nr:DNA polymerase III subunit gamma/tau [Solirubrobacteraceae bacterium]
MSVEEQPQDEQRSESQRRSLYRRHRPRTFAEVVGQEPVVRTLRNAVQRDAVHHAYLFVGSRGTGKTSMAKILAACLNCERGPTIEPCGVCDSCVSIAGATSLDVIEMDAASNNSVDDIRDLRDSVAYAPVSGRRKVYILDEAHMLSTAAWNAFLKTLEEPPPNTVFVLATTEANKVPATVVDRCHRFDFHRPTVEQIASVVRRAAQAESIEIPPAAVAALARHATGSFRDALGTLEQIVTYSGREIALEDVLAVLGVADARLLEETVDAVAAGDAARALRTLEECVEQGRDAGSFASDLEVRARELLVVQVLGEVPAELSLTPEADAALSAQAQRVDHATVVRVLELLGEAMEGVRAGADARTRLELALVKAARPETDGSTRALLARIERLERGTPRAGVESEPVRPSEPEREPASAAVPEPELVPEPAREPEPAPEPVSDPVPRDIESVYALWPAVVELVRSEHALLGAVIGEARPVAVDGDELTLAYPFTAEFYKKKAEDPANRAAVGEALGALAGGRWRLRYELRETPASEDGAAAGGRSEEEWVARFKEEFDAEELTDEESRNGGEAQASDEDVQDERGAQAATGNEKGA